MLIRLHSLFFRVTLCLLSFPLAAYSQPSDSRTARNVILFLADDMGQDAGCYGNAVIRTPHLDALAKNGTRFSDAFCTTASCSPSRSVIKTGLHNHANGQYGLAHAEHNFVTRPGVETLPILMRQAGYRTGRFGRTLHVRPLELYDFDVILPDATPPLTLEKRLYGRNIIQCVEDAAAYISTPDPRPFFIMIAAADAHRFGTTFAHLPGRPNTFDNDHAYREVEEVTYLPDQVLVPAFLNDDLATRAELAQYYRCISRIDQGIGRLVEVLKRTGHWDDTLIIFTSDHGAPFPGAKTTAYEPGLRVPYVVRDPRAAKTGIVSNALVSLVDIAPTILDYAGAGSAAVKMHGRSILPVLEREETAGWEEVYASHTFHQITGYYPMRVVRERRYKLIWNVAHPLEFPLADDLEKSATWQKAVAGDGPSMLGRRSLNAYMKRPEFELYDLEHDPDEIRNLAVDRTHRVLLERLVEKLRAFQQKTNDPWRGKLRIE